MFQRRTLLSAFLALFFLSSFAFSACAENSGANVSHDGSQIALSAPGGVYGEEFTLYAAPSNSENTLYYSLDGTASKKATTRYDKKGIAITDRTETSSYPLTNGIDNMGYESKKSGCGTVVRFSERNREGVEVASKTVTYIIDPAYTALEKEYRIPVVCLTAETSLWLGDKMHVGFYEDVESDRKERVELEYYDASLQESFSLSTQIKLGGNWTKRNYPKRTFNLNWKWADDAHTVKNPKLSKLGVHLFGKDATAQDGSPLQDVTRVRLHSGGNAFSMTNFNDALAQSIASYDQTIATSASRPCLLYLNGEFWGYYIIREHYSDSYFENNYGVDKDNVIYCDRTTDLEEPHAYQYSIKTYNEEEPVTIGGRTTTRLSYSRQCLDELYGVLLGDSDRTYTAYSPSGNEVLSVKEVRDMARDEESYEKLCALVDIDSLIDMILIEAYVGNWDFFYNNMRMWRVADPALEDQGNPYADGKWRFCLHDLDFSFEDPNGCVNIANGNVLESYTGLNSAYNLTSGPSSEMVASLLSAPMTNENFRARFLERAKIIRELFAYSPKSAAKNLYDNFRNAFSCYKEKEYSRWNGVEHNEERYRATASAMKTFLMERGDVFSQQVVSFARDYAFSQTPSVTVTDLSDYVAGAALFAISDITDGKKVNALDELLGENVITQESGISFTFTLKNSYSDWNAVLSTLSVRLYTGVMQWNGNNWYEANDDMPGIHGNEYWKKLLFDSRDFDNKNKQIVVTINCVDGKTEFYRNGELVYRYAKGNDNGRQNGKNTMYYAVSNLISECKACGFTWLAIGMESAELKFIGTGLTERQAKEVATLIP